jgi:glycerol-3-phosphate dehydrogenase
MSSHYDVVIIGGGIHGTGVAQAAAANGYSVLVLEQTELACGTSSRSSKLIHGGLRYLETMQIALVRESLHERQLLLKLAPDLVHLVPFYIPVYKTTRRRSWQIRAGLSLYAMLAGAGANNRFVTIPRSRWSGLDGLDTRDLQAVFCYQDGQTDDAVLTRAVMRSAQNLEAELLLPATFSSAVIESDKISIEYQQNGNTCSCTATVLVNAGGPWVNRILEKILPSPPVLDIDLVRGTHIRVAGTFNVGIYYMETPQDGRAVFAMPREGSILVGTTEALYQHDPADVQAVPEEQQYLLEVLAHYFPHYRSDQNQTILSAYAGLRVLPKGKGKAFQRSRETTLLVDNEQTPRVLSIYGGKLTTWRATATKVITRLSPGLPSRKIRARTETIRLFPA